MNLTVLDMVCMALRLINVLAASEQPTNTEGNMALITLNMMIDSWGIQNLLIFAKTVETFQFKVLQQSYQMGPGAPDFNTIRPQKIENALYQQSNGTTTFNLTINIINQDEWAAITVPTTQSPIPTHLWVQYTNPYATLNFWPVPNAVQNLILHSWKPLSQFATLQTVIAVPPGYLKAIVYNLALELAPQYGKKNIDPLVVAQATDSKADVKRMNTREYLMRTDIAIQRDQSGAGYNWLTGESS